MRGASKLRRIGIFAITLMVISSMVAPSAMAASSTVSSPDDGCRNSYSEAFLEAITLRAQPLVDEGECKAQEIVSNSTWIDSYVSGLGLKDLQKAGLTPIGNHLDDSKTYARTIAKTQAVRAFNNGSTESEIDAKVNSSINDYYANMERNVWHTHESNVIQAFYIYKAHAQSVDPQVNSTTANNEALYISVSQHANGSIGSAPIRNDEGASPDPLGYWSDQEVTELHNGTTTLLDGSTFNYTALYYEYSAFYYGDPSDELNYTQSLDSTGGPYNLAAWVVDPQEAESTFDSGVGNYAQSELTKANSVEIYDEHAYREALINIRRTSSDVKVQAEQFTDLLFANYNQSEGVPISEVLNPNDLASQWNTNYNTTGYYGWIASTLGLSGLEGNVNSSFAINYTPRVDQLDNGNYSLNGSGTHDYVYQNGTTYNISGTLMTDWDPNPNQSYAFERGATYDTANANAPVLFIEQVNSTKSRVVRLNGTFTIDTLTNVQTGETINSTSLEEQNQQTWNESSSVEEIRQLVEYRNKSVTINEAGGGGGTGGGGLFDGFNFGSAGLGFIVIAGGGALLLLNRS